MDVDLAFFRKWAGRYNVLAVLENRRTGKKRRIWGKNILTTKGNQYYAAAGAAEASAFTLTALRLGINSTAPSAGDADVLTSFASCGQALDVDYPMTSDTDTDNTSAASNVVTWRATWGTADASQAGIVEVAVADSYANPSNIINRALFTAAFDKTSSDTLKIFVNHTFSGV
jgi:hypothetical protein